MVINDWHRTMAWMVAASEEDPNGEQPETRGVRLMLARQEASACFEAMQFIAESRKRFPVVEAFVKGLGREAQEYIDAVEAGVDRKSPEYQEWLEGHRNVTSHYPEISPEKYAAGNEEIAIALKRADAAGVQGTVTVGARDSSLRFHYADEVAVQLLPDVTENPGLVRALAQARMAIGRFAGLAFAAYRAAHAEAFRLEGD